MGASPDLPRPRHSVIVYNARLGLVLFLVYCLLYGGFIYLNTFARDKAAAEAFDGINVALVYGGALIVGAFVISIIYMSLCRFERDGGSLSAGANADMPNAKTPGEDVSDGEPR